MEVVVNNDKSQVIEAAFLPRQRFDVSASSSPSSSRGCGGFALVVEVCRNGILGRGVSDGDFQELLRHSWGLVPERVNECLTRGAASEGVDDVGFEALSSGGGTCYDGLELVALWRRDSELAFFRAIFRKCRGSRIFSLVSGSGVSGMSPR